MMMKSGLIVSLLITLSGCSTLTGNILTERAATKVSCFPALVDLDKLALQSGGTLIGNRISGVPWLRHNRLITHDIVKQTYSKPLYELLSRMSVLAQQGLRYELATVSAKQQKHWQSRYQIKTTNDQFVKACSNQLLQAQLNSPKKTLADLKAIPKDNDYSTLARVAGFYPLATVPFRLGVVKEQQQLQADWRKIDGKHWISYQPVSLNITSSPSAMVLLNRHAPVWHIDSDSSANLPGALYWQGEQLEVNTKQATSYAFVSEARWKQQLVTQLNYVLWFTERPQLKRLDWVAGQHDAVVFRVNLDQAGEVIAYDSIHLCGCWYRLFITEEFPFKPSNSYWREPILMHRISLPSKSKPQMAIYLQSDTHQIQYLQPVTEAVIKVDQAVVAKNYQLQPFSTLLQLPTASGVRPVFNRSGYVTGSERPERWLFWPMGVKNPGALRRFGDHAISFVGRRYFDDPNLLSYFTLAPGNNDTGSNDNEYAH